METSLHRQLKHLYAEPNGQIEAPLDGYRIDVANDGELVEIQHGSLAAIRDKVRKLLQNYRVRIVKPIIVRKRLIKQDRRGGKVIDRRWSPKRGTIFDLFDELVYFTKVFPHPNLVLEAPLVTIEEWRRPGHGRRRRHRDNDFIIVDQKLTSIEPGATLRTAADLISLASVELPERFHTGHLAEALDVPRWVAQRMAYCWRETGGARVVGKEGRALLYEMVKED